MAVTPDDLQTYLGSPNFDAERAELLISTAVSLCEAIVKPLPESADAVILSSAGRAYTNATGVTSQMAGPYQVTMPSGGVYLTKSERATLRRLAGGGGAFSIDMLAGYSARFDEPVTP